MTRDPGVPHARSRLIEVAAVKGDAIEEFILEDGPTRAKTSHQPDILALAGDSGEGAWRNLLGDRRNRIARVPGVIAVAKVTFAMNLVCPAFSHRFEDFPDGSLVSGRVI